jgi:hypothetical protein
MGRINGEGGGPSKRLCTYVGYAHSEGSDIFHAILTRSLSVKPNNWRQVCQLVVIYDVTTFKNLHQMFKCDIWTSDDELTSGSSVELTTILSSEICIYAILGRLSVPRIDWILAIPQEDRTKTMQCPLELEIWIEDWEPCEWCYITTINQKVNNDEHSKVSSREPMDDATEV